MNKVRNTDTHRAADLLLQATPPPICEEHIEFKEDGCEQCEREWAHFIAANRPKIVALTSIQGTACSETALIDAEDTPENRAKIESQAIGNKSPDRPIPGTWTDVSDNEALWPES